MNDQETLTCLMQELDGPQARFHRLDRYYNGDAPLSFISPEARKQLGNRLDRLSIGIPRLAVDAVAERLRVTGLSDVWDEWTANDLDQTSAQLHRESLVLGAGYVIVWADQQGNPTVTVESARQVTTLHDPGTRRTVAALKRWEDRTATHAIVYLPDRIIRYRADSKGAHAGFKVVDELDNPLGWTPVVRFANTDRIHGCGQSEMEPVLSLTDAITKLNVDLLTASEFAARPRRWATGLELSEDENGEAENPIADNDRLMVNEDPAGKFGQLEGSNLAGYTEALGQLYRQISAVSGLPEHMLGIGGDNPQSADSIRASEAALTARAEARQAVFGRQWEHVGRLMAAVRDGTDPDQVECRVKWADPSTRSQAEESDSVTKLFAAGLLPASAALRKLGYSADEIDQIRTERRADGLDNIDMGQVMSA